MSRHLALAITMFGAAFTCSKASGQNPTFYSRDYYPRIRIVFDPSGTGALSSAASRGPCS